MRKFLSAILSLVLCLSLVPSALATETFNTSEATVGTPEVISDLGVNKDMTFTIFNVLDKRTVMLNIADYDYNTDSYIAETRTITLYQIPTTGAKINLSVKAGSTSMAFPGGWEAFRLQDGMYGPNEDGEYFFGQLGYADAINPWDDVLDLSEAGFQKNDILGLLVDDDSTVIYLTCGNLDEIVAAAGVAVEETSDPDNPFQDVFFDAYYYNAVIWAYKNGVTSGTSDTTFSPNDTCTRGQVVTFLWRAMGCPEPTITSNPFTDVKESDYYYKAVLWAVERRITTGITSTTFGPKDTCTSGHVITFLWRANGSPATAHKTESVPAGKWYTDAVSWGESQDLFAMIYPAFAPDNNAPRAEIVTYLYLNAQN